MPRVNRDFVTALRMVDNTGRYRWFVYIIDEAEPADNVCNSRICSISIFDIRVFFKHTDTKADNTYMEYFSLMEYLMFSYDVSTDRLRIFMMESHQQVDFYRGTLATGVEQCLPMAMCMALHAIYLILFVMILPMEQRYLNVSLR